MPAPTSASVAAPQGAAVPSPSWPAGFVAATASAAIKKPGRTDMALLVCPGGAAAAGMFTRNQVCAAPVQLSRRHLAESRGHASALLLNSGCANAATGEQGMAAAVECTDAVAAALEVDPSSILVNSTGVIGVQLPLDRMLPRIPEMAAAAVAGPVEPFARAIMTTDTSPKMAAAEVPARNGGRAARVVGVAKGAGMIHPDMATMISVITTDAEVDPEALRGLLGRAVERSFHRVSIDGDTSTNDSVFALASGSAGPADPGALQAAFTEVARSLALQVVRDGEGYERGIHVRVTGAATAADALAVARTIAQSLLVRTAVTGGDPNWGRILAAAGRAGVPLAVDRVHLSVGGVDLFRDGAPSATPLAERERVFRGTMVEIRLDLGQGGQEEEYFSCGLTEAYVRLNAEYTT